MSDEWALSLGANGNEFLVWAPLHQKLTVEIVGKGLFPMQPYQEGFFYAKIEGAKAGDLYYYQFANGIKRADPVSRFLPEGAFGPTEIIDPKQYHWNDKEWKGLDFEEYILYEMHIGLFTEEGTLRGIEKKIAYLKKLGITCIELMPLTQFVGRCNWGYDGVSLFAPFAGYGRPEDVKHLIDLCHQEGIAVCLDVVYSHLGPTGNFLAEFAPYFRKDYQTLWGETFNYDGSHSTHIRRMMMENALYWIAEYHIDCLRLDAVHGIYDRSEKFFLRELVVAVENLGAQLGRKVHLMAESEDNNSMLIRPSEEGGYGIRALWNEDFHHSLHTLLTDETWSYYHEFSGGRDVAKALRRGFVYDQGGSCKGISWDHFVIFAQNHDQIGNRPWGDRLSTLLSHEARRIVPFFIVLTPAVPLLFMGEEYGEKNPFCYFVDFDHALMEIVSEGRKRELHTEKMMPPTYESFLRCKMSWEEDEELLGIYCELIALRKSFPPKKSKIGEKDVEVWFEEENSLLAWSYFSGSEKIGVICYWGKKPLNEYTMPFKGEILFRSSAEVTDQNLPSFSALVIKRK